MERVHGGMEEVGELPSLMKDLEKPKKKKKKKKPPAARTKPKTAAVRKRKNDVEEILGRRRRKVDKRKTIEGMPYYYNEKTEELTWDKPDALKSEIRSREKLRIGVGKRKRRRDGYPREVARESGVSNLPS